jgi:hypothetical protein
MSFFSDFLSADILPVIFCHKICRRYVIFFWLKVGVKKWHKVGTKLSHFYFDIFSVSKKIPKFCQFFVLPTLCHFLMTKYQFLKMTHGRPDIMSFFLMSVLKNEKCRAIIIKWINVGRFKKCVFFFCFCS